MSSLPIISLTKAKHRDTYQILIGFKYNWKLINVVKHIPNAKWSKTLTSWYVRNNPKNLKLIYSVFKGHAQIDNRLGFESNLEKTLSNRFPSKRKRQLDDEQRTILNAFYKYLKGKRYSQSTVDTYSFFMADFIEYYGDKPLTQLNNRSIEVFIENIFIKRKYSISTQRQFISAVKQFIVFYPNTNINSLQLERPKKSRKLPIVLSPQDVISIIQHTKNLKHRAILVLLYSSGLRIGELLKLKLSDFNIERRQLFIRSGKGRKDRYVGLADSFLPLLHNYVITYKPQFYFVEGSKGKPYSASSVRKFLSRSCRAAGLHQVITPHVLRHSYATHLLENGVGLRHIQELLGHAKPETTMIYTHVARKDLLEIKSPLDMTIQQLSDLDKLEHKFLLSRK